MSRSARHVAIFSGGRPPAVRGRGGTGLSRRALGAALEPPLSTSRGIVGGSSRPYALFGVPGLAVGEESLNPATGFTDVTRDETSDEEDPPRRRRRLEAVLLMSKSPLSTRKLAQLARLADGTEARTLVRELNRLYDSHGRAIRVESVAGGYRMMTRPAIAPWLVRLGHLPPATQLSSPMMETLTVVAYRQPVSRADVEAIRGVNCGELLRQLLERDLIRIAGRGEELGRPYLYGTTKRFLQLFGLSGADTLPAIDWLALQDETARESPTSSKESVVSTAVPPVATETELDSSGFSNDFAIDPSVPHDSPQAVIEDEEDEIYEGGAVDDDDEIDEWEVERVDEVDDGDIDEDFDDEADDEDDDDEIEDDEPDDEWVEVDDSDDDWDDDEEDDDWDEEDDDEDEDWD